jgi:small subunit ribosomal protein S19
VIEKIKNEVVRSFKYNKMSLAYQFALKKDAIKSNFKFWTGNHIITPSLVGKDVEVYNGKIFKSFKVLELMVGYKVGHFIFTRRVGSDIHKSKKFKKK